MAIDMSCYWAFIVGRLKVKPIVDGQTTWEVQDQEGIFFGGFPHKKWLYPS
jgi:hypothetical protein